jgi:lysine N6-hydroxylase
MLENDLVGVGAGPTNLSLAALTETPRVRGLIQFQSKFLEKNRAIQWHAGQLFPGTLMQTEFYRDLVTPIDPTSSFTFLNYLKAHQRLDQFFCSEYICPTRREFEDYLSWVARQLPDVIFGSNVTFVDYDPETNGFVIDAESGQERTRYTSRHIVLGCGSTPESTIANRKGARVVHVSDLLTFEFPEPLQSVLIVGSGQSGAECVNFLLDRFAEVEVQITWITHETAFRSLDKGNFSREAYSAGYGMSFARLPAALREKTIREESNIAYGITPELTKALYQRLYSLKHLNERDTSCPTVQMQANVEVIEVRNDAEAALVAARDLELGETRTVFYSCVVLCTGFEDQSVFDSSMIGPQLKSRIGRRDDRLDYAVPWDGPLDRMIFVQSENIKTHGLGDANFVTAPGRNARILNTITGKEIYSIDQMDRLVGVRAIGRQALK